MLTTPIIYTRPGCSESLRLRTWLVHHRVPFIERNITIDPVDEVVLHQTGIAATPLLVIDEHLVFGFHPDELAEMLAIEDGMSDLSAGWEPPMNRGERLPIS